MKILHLTIKKKWFDMILSGDKTEEYREIKPYWRIRLLNKKYTHALFRNGYKSDSPKALFELEQICIGEGRLAWGAPKGIEVFILALGKRVD